jgi:hypothetical protein
MYGGPAFGGLLLMSTSFVLFAITFLAKSDSILLHVGVFFFAAIWTLKGVEYVVNFVTHRAQSILY